MSSLEALGIAGFRGYNPKEIQKIEFYKPLTLIWGKNGSGKTVKLLLFRRSYNASNILQQAVFLLLALKEKVLLWIQKLPERRRYKQMFDLNLEL
jgi:hypothetical protein